MGRTISDDEAIEAAWDTQLPSLRIELPITNAHELKQLYAARGDKTYADIGIWLAMCSLASSASGHALSADNELLASQLYGSRGKSTIVAEHVNALVAAGLAFIGVDGLLYIPAIETEFVRHGKMIVGGMRGGRPRKKKRRRMQ